MPIQRRLPKFGFHHRGRVVYQVVNVSALNDFSGEEVTPETLQEAGFIKKLTQPVKILGDGELNKKLTVKVHAVSKSAREKIEKAGGTVTLI